MHLPFFAFPGNSPGKVAVVGVLAQRCLGALALLVVALVLAGCDSQRIAELEEGVATEADVRARFGEPEKIWSAADLAGSAFPAAAAQPGARTFEYNRQPQGQVNYMITLGADGKMSALRQVLSPQNFALVLPGLSVEQVRKMLGKPMKVTPFPLKRETHYEWRYGDGPNTSRIFRVEFDADLRVLRTGSVLDEPQSGTSGGG